MIRGLMQPTPLNLRSIFERMRTVYGDGVVVDPEGAVTYAACAERVERLCGVLTTLGVRPGDRVATFAWNSRRHFELYWAVPLVGAVLHTVNIRLHADQVAAIVNHAADRVIFVDADLVPVLAPVLPRLRTVERVVVMGDCGEAALPGAASYEELVARAAPVRDLPDLPEDAACGLCYTSGTTGMPKGVLSSHRGMWLHAMATCMADHIGLSERDRVLPVVPMFHAFAWGLPYSAPFTGAELVFHGSDSSPAHLAKIIEAERVTVAAGVPTIWKGLLPVLQRGEADVSSLRLVFVGGSASPRSLIEAYEDLGIELLQVWGMTETGPLACASRPRRRHRGLSRGELLDVRARTGTIFSGLEARIVGPDGESLPWDGTAVGELEVRGPWIASAYYEAPGSENRFHEGWLRTGDMAQMERDGHFRIVDRAKDLVKSGGEWISSVELEGLLLGHPGVADAAVVGVRSRAWDERPVAVIVPRGAAPTLESVRDFLAGKVAKWWLPDAVVLVEEIPKTSVGKIDKKALRDQLAGMELP
jgi:fatty-acyl-CoA synthase